MTTYFDAYRTYAKAILRMRDKNVPLWKISETFCVPRARLECEFRRIDELKAELTASRWPNAKLIVDKQEYPVEMPCKVPSAMAVL
jgi:hypothetical protein